MDDKYKITKPKKPETKLEILQEKIEELVKLRDKESNPAAKQKLNAEITTLFEAETGWKIEPRDWTDAERVAAERIRREKYASDDWNRKR